MTVSLLVDYRQLPILPYYSFATKFYHVYHIYKNYHVDQLSTGIYHVYSFTTKFYHVQTSYHKYKYHYVYHVYQLSTNATMSTVATSLPCLPCLQHLPQLQLCYQVLPNSYHKTVLLPVHYQVLPISYQSATTSKVTTMLTWGFQGLLMLPSQFAYNAGFLVISCLVISL